MSDIPRYNMILQAQRRDLDLSCNDYCVADTIYHLSNNPENKHGSWCYASKETLGEMLALSKPTIHKIIIKLITKKLVIKHEVTKHLKTTQLWYDTVVLERRRMNSGKESLPRVKRVDFQQSTILTSSGKEILHNKDNNINNDNHELSEEEKTRINARCEEISAFVKNLPHRQ